MLDRPVFSGRVAPLEDDQERKPSVRIEDLLQLGDTLRLLIGRLAQLVAFRGVLRATSSTISEGYVVVRVDRLETHYFASSFRPALRLSKFSKVLNTRK